MAVKEWFRKFQPVQLYLVLFFTVSFFVVEIIASHITHSLTLLLNAYHMLCNIVALIGCIASIKYAHKDNNCENAAGRNHRASSTKVSSICINEDENPQPTIAQKQSCSDRRMKNTFGWARIDIVTMLVCCVLLASFCFSLTIEALQTLIHIKHKMHNPIPVMGIGISGILLNGFCYVIIGGYTFNQGISLHVTEEGNVILQRKIPSEMSVRASGDRQLSSIVNDRTSPVVLSKRHGFREISRDALGCLIVVITSVMVYYTDAHLAKFIDPIFAIISAISLLALSYPYMRESGLILLQTIPNHINIDLLKKKLLAEFPGIVNVHDLHVWHLAGRKVISTAHIIFLDPMVYASIGHQVTAFFVELGITQVTIQPEFHKMKPNSPKSLCLICCRGERCKSSQCCSVVKEQHQGSAIGDDHCGGSCDNGGNRSEPKRLVDGKKFVKKDIIPSTSMVDLKKFTHIDDCSNAATDANTYHSPACQAIESPSSKTLSQSSVIHRKSYPEGGKKSFSIDIKVVEPKVSNDSSDVNDTNACSVLVVPAASNNHRQCGHQPSDCIDT